MSELGSFVWGIADILRGPFKPKEYGTVILPFTTLRRLECAMEPHRTVMREVLAKAKGNPIVIRSQLRQRTATATGPGLAFWNTSPYTLATALKDVDNLAANLIDYINGFSADVDMFKHFNKTGFEPIIRELDANGLLVLVTRKFSEIDLSPGTISNAGMGDLFEELIYKFAEASNDKAGDFYTPRDAIRLLVDLVFAEDTDALSGHAVRSVYDPTAGTGGMLSVAEEHVRDMNPDAELRLFAQEINGDSYAICKADMLIKGQDVSNVKKGDTLAADAFPDIGFDYILSNPPFGQDWEAAEKVVRDENGGQSFEPSNPTKELTGRFGAGLPSIGDGAMLFLQHAASKMRPVDEFGRGGRAGIVLSGSPLFNGAAGSGPSNIRGWLLENDLVETIVGLPSDMFYNTGIGTYLWILDNTKPEGRQGKVRLIDATGYATKMRKSLGAKRVEISPDHRTLIVRAAAGEDSTVPVKDFDNLDFAYWQVTVERPFQWAFQVTPERIDAVEEAVEADRAAARAKGETEAAKAKTEPAREAARIKHAPKKLGAVNGLPAALRTFGEKTYDSRTEFLADLGSHLTTAGIALTASQRTDLWKLLGEHDPAAQIETNGKGEAEPDASLRDSELVPFGWGGHDNAHDARDETIRAYLAMEVLPHAPGAWIDEAKTKVGYEIPFTRHFYRYVAPRPLSEIDADLEASVARIMALLKEVEGDV